MYGWKVVALGMHIIHAWPENAVKAVSKTPLPLNVWNHF